MTRKLKKGGYAAILSVIVIAAVVLLNMIVGRLPEKVRRWDLSGTQIYTVGDTTKELWHLSIRTLRFMWWRIQPWWMTELQAL